MRLLVVDDEQDINDSLCRRLRKAGYSTDSCYNGEEALDYLRMGDFDGVIMDIMMPKLSGLDALRIMRREGSSVPVLLLTAKDTIEDIVCGLDSGAEAYMVKPFVFEELLARIRAMIRKQVGTATNQFCVADLTIDIATRKVTRGNAEIELSAREFELLEYMVRNKGIVLSKERIETNIWSLDYCGDSNVIQVYIRMLRKKIDDPFEIKLIHTVRGAGYVVRDENEKM